MINDIHQNYDRDYHYFLYKIYYIMKTSITYLFHWLFLINCEPLDLLLYHSNNIYSHFEEDKSGVGGAARASHILRVARQKAAEKTGPPVLYLNAGDNFGGSYLYHRLKWRIVADVLYILKPDVMCLGNHDFDEGPKNLTRFLEKVKIPTVGANIDVSKEEGLRELIKPYHLINVANWTVGIIGYTTKKMNRSLHPDGIEFTDELEAVRRESRKLRTMGIKIIIALGHAGEVVDERIAKEVKDVDIVVGGHRKSWMTKKKSSGKTSVRKNGREVLILYEPGYLRYLGMARIYFNQYGDVVKYTRQPIFLHSKLLKDRSIRNLLLKEQANGEREILGKTRVTLSADCLASECNLGNLMADALCDHLANLYKGMFWTDFPIAVINSGLFRETINITHTKELTIAQIEKILHFNSMSCTLEIEGRYLKQALEQSVIWDDTSTGQLLQVAGVHVEYDFNKQKGSRIRRVYLRCHNCKIPQYFPLEDDRTYRIITTRHVTIGVDGHYGISDNMQKLEFGQDLGVILQHYIRNFTVVSPDVEDRIVIENNKCPNLRATRLLVVWFAIEQILGILLKG